MLLGWASRLQSLARRELTLVILLGQLAGSTAGAAWAIGSWLIVLWLQRRHAVEATADDDGTT